MLERELSGDIELGGCRSRGLERAVLERELSGGYSSRGYRSRGPIEVGFW